MAANAAAWVLFLVVREPLDAQSWSSLEQQRPWARPPNEFMSWCSDCLNFALARRQVGGWEALLVSITMVLNLPATVAAWATFDALQATTIASSKFNSDVATAVFCIASALQWWLIAFLLSLRRSAASAGGQDHVPGTAK